MDKFGIQCPPKMLIPFGLTYFVNFFAQEIKVQPDNYSVKIKFDPTSIGILSDRVIDLLPPVNSFN